MLSKEGESLLLCASDNTAQDGYITFCAARACRWLTFNFLSFKTFETLQKICTTGSDLLKDAEILFRSCYVFVACLENLFTLGTLKEALSGHVYPTGLWSKTVPVHLKMLIG